MRGSRYLLQGFGLLLLVALVAACGAPAQSPGSSAPAASPSGGGSAAQTSAPPATPAPAAVKELVIGGINPMSGPAANYGISTTNGITLAVEEINAAGGVKVGNETYKVVYRNLDDRGVPEEAVAAFERLIRDQVPVVIGPFLSSTAAAVLPVAEQREVPFISPGAASPALVTEKTRHFFRGGSTAEVYGPIVGTPVMKAMALPKVSLLVVNDAWGKGYEKVWSNIIRNSGSELISVEYFQRDQKDFYALLNRVKAQQPSGLVVLSQVQTSLPLYPQIREVMGNITVLEAGGTDAEFLIKDVPKAAEGVIFISREGPMTPQLEAFGNRYRSRFNDVANSYAISGYDNMMLVVKAIQKAGTTSDRAKIREAIRSIRHEGLRGVYTFSANGENNMGAFYGYIQGGQIRRFDPAKDDPVQVLKAILGR